MASSENVTEAGRDADAVEMDAVKTKHEDGTVSFAGRAALGGGLEEMPKGYFRSVQFVGTVVVTFSRFQAGAGRIADAVLIGRLLCEYLCEFRLDVACVCFVRFFLPIA